jgi:hypothetical protein
MSKNESKKYETVRISVTLRKDVYEDIKKISHGLGIRPSSWVSMKLTSGVKKNSKGGE